MIAVAVQIDQIRVRQLKRVQSHGRSRQLSVTARTDDATDAIWLVPLIRHATFVTHGMPCVRYPAYEQYEHTYCKIIATVKQTFLPNGFMTS